MDHTLYDILATVLLYLTSSTNHSIHALTILRPIYERNSILLKWNDSSSGDYVLQIKMDGKSMPEVHMKHSSYKITNALLHRRYDVKVIGNSTSRPSKTVTFYTPPVVPAVVGSTKAIIWSLSSASRLLGYRVRNVDTNVIYMEFDGKKVHNTHQSFRLNGNPQSLKTSTSLTIKGVELRFGGYIVSESSSSQVYGGVVLKVIGQPLTPLITISKENLIFGENMTDSETGARILLKCSGKANSTPSYINLPAITYEWYSNKSDQLPANFVKNGSTLTVTHVRKLDAFLKISCRAFHHTAASQYSEEINLHVLCPTYSADATPFYHRVWFYVLVGGVPLVLLAVENAFILYHQMLQRKGCMAAMMNQTALFKQAQPSTTSYLDDKEETNYMDISLQDTGRKKSRLETARGKHGNKELKPGEQIVGEDDCLSIQYEDPTLAELQIGERKRCFAANPMEIEDSLGYDELEYNEDEGESKYRSLKRNSEINTGTGREKVRLKKTGKKRIIYKNVRDKIMRRM